jgi:hypothetical protein
MRLIDYHRTAYIIQTTQDLKPINFQITIDRETRFLDQDRAPVGEYPEDMRILEIKYPRGLLNKFLELDGVLIPEYRLNLLRQLDAEVPGAYALYNLRLGLLERNDARFDSGHGKLHNSFKRAN